MSYTTDPKIAKVRWQAAQLVKQGWTTRKVARHFGYSHSSVVRWCAKGPVDGRAGIVTRSSKPKSHPRALKPEIVTAIIQERQKHGRCAEVVHFDLKERGIQVSLSSVKRTLSRHEMLKTKTYKRTHLRVPRPPAEAPGDLVETDTIHIHDWMTGKRFYVYTLIDVCSRWAYAELHEQLRSKIALEFVLRAQRGADFRFKVIQSDNGPEFAVWFREMLQARSSMVLRHTRVRRPTDNAHVERFNGIIQTECFTHHATWEGAQQTDLIGYLDYYNNHRRHMGLDFARPAEVVQRY